MHRLGVRREGARPGGIEIPPAASRRDVDGARVRPHDRVAHERFRALVVVIVSHEDDVDVVLVEQRHQVRTDRRTAAMVAARVDRVVEGDELPPLAGRGEILIEEVVLRAARARALVAVQHGEMGVAEVEGVVVLASGRVVGGCGKDVSPWLPARGLPVVVAEAGPEDEPADEVFVGREELRVEVGRRAAVVDHVAGVEDHVGGGREHAVADGELGRAAVAGVAHHEEGVGRGRVVGLEDRLATERGAAGAWRVAVLDTGREARDGDRAHGVAAATQDAGRAAERSNGERARRGRVGVPHDGHGVGGEELQVRAARERHGASIGEREGYARQRADKRRSDPGLPRRHALTSHLLCHPRCATEEPSRSESDGPRNLLRNCRGT